MSYSNQGGSGKPETRYWIFIVSVVTLGFLVFIGIQQLVDRSDATRNAAVYAANTKNQIAAECVTPAEYEKCSLQIELASEGSQRDEYDLYSQKTMALWTTVMGIMAVMGVGLSALGVYLIWHTWEATREAAIHSRTMAEEAQKATGAALLSAQASHDANEISKNQVRAYLQLTEPMVQISPFGGMKYNVFFTLENAGHSKATDLWFVCESRWGDPRTPDDYIEHTSDIIPIDPLNGQAKLKVTEAIECLPMSTFQNRMESIRHCEFTIRLSGHDMFRDPVDLKAFAVFLSPLEPMGTKVRIMSRMHERHRVSRIERGDSEG